jgi:cytochrome c-type biogenesis protein CcmH
VITTRTVRRWAPWAVLALVLVVALAAGATGDSGSDGGDSVEARTARLSRELRCPTCRGLSVADSDAKAAQAIRDEIAARVEAGQTDDEVRAFLVSRYGEDILLEPSGSGFTGLVWALPVAVGVIAAAGLAVAFRRWRTGP